MTKGESIMSNYDRITLLAIFIFVVMISGYIRLPIH
jgi:hypothetical protein